MTIEEIAMTGTVGCQGQICRPAVIQDNRRHPLADTSDDALDDPIILVPTPEPVWPRVWPGL